MKKHITKNTFQTRKAGGDFARKIIKSNALRLDSEKIRGKAVVLGLKGDLGGGKTAFLQGFAKGLGIKEKILSPTFVVMRKFKIPEAKFITFYHLDCYRIQSPKEILDLGFSKILSEPKSIIAVEWAERIKKILPKNTLWLEFDFINKNTRKITIK